MHIRHIMSQHRRDFYAVYKCEHCGHEVKGDGYDDTNFHHNVVPKMACENCGRKAEDTSRAATPRYPDDYTI